ncbi:acyl-CoA dehydrogenase family protein [Bacillus sp. AGMB 02131]|uniref:Acyl-CoA dehydrogenase family protein n=1 Tax=Peribacillus faecalis TaxID=2772559 RepID=A0A927CXX8_9BACI|nr:acyl-CoA dehydrogenase family protein [Peribacillus faecalis]MBD3107965.1 acyl-CoA dehydrogenase family protein [Peribacillus faecalis]
MAHKYLKEEHEIFRESVRKFLDKEVRPFFHEWEKQRSTPKDLWGKFGEQGFLVPWAEEKYGGFNADFAYSVVLIEEFEKVASGIGTGLHNDIIVPYIATYGTEEQKDRWIPKCVSGEWSTAIAMTEPGAGSDLGNIQTRAVKKGDHYVINGEKTFISNGLKANLVIVACKTDMNAGHKGISLIVVEEGTPGFKRGKKLEKIGQHAADTSELIFEDAIVPAENLLGQENKGFYYLMEKLQQERLVCVIQAQTAAEESLKMTIEYVKQRPMFGKTLSSLQNTQFKIAEMATEVELGRMFLDDLIVQHMANKDVATQVSMAKWWTTEMAKRVIGQCMQFHGGYGYMEEYPIARRYRDIAVTSIYAGSNEVMKQIVAKRLGL